MGSSERSAGRNDRSANKSRDQRGGKPTGGKAGGKTGGKTYGKSSGRPSGKSSGGSSAGRSTGGYRGASGKAGADGESVAGGKPRTGGKPRPGGKARSSAKSAGKSGGKAYGRSQDKGAPSSSERKPRSREDRPAERDRRPAPRPERTSAFDEQLIEAVAREQVLPREAATELETFPPRVKDLLGAAYVLLEEDPAEALRYAVEAKRMAGRSSVVREAVGVVAYHAGDFELAAKELRAARRISGLDTLVPLIADCERALGHPERALALSEEDLQLDRENRVELRIVAAGARMDLGQPEAAQLLLRGRLLDSEDQTPASARLKYAYAEALLAAGDPDRAKDWFLRAAAADAEGDTDAEERAITLLAGPVG